MQTQPRETHAPEGAADRETLALQVRTLQERLAFYEGFDLLIQDNVAHARELFRLAAQEREAAASASDRSRKDAGLREAHLRAELAIIARDLTEVAEAVEVLSRRVARALGEPAGANGAAPAAEPEMEHLLTVLVHGVPSARAALSLQRFVGTLPHVAGVSAREFAGGVLRLDARVRERLEVDQFRTWDESWRLETLTERADVIEFALRDEG